MSVIYLLEDPFVSAHFKVGVGSTIKECIEKETYTQRLFGNEIKIPPEVVGWIELDKSGDVDTLRKGLYLNLGNKCISKEEGTFRDVSIEEIARAANRCNRNGKIHKDISSISEDCSPTIPSTPHSESDMLTAEDYECVNELMSLDDSWTNSLRLCIAYEKNGKTISGRTKYVGQWLEDQKLSVESLSEEQLENLLQINTFKEWYYKRNKRQRIERSWEESFQLCLEYEKEYGEIVGSSKFKEAKIGIWFSNQKQSIRGTSKTKISEKQIKQLMELETFRKWYNEGEITKKRKHE